MRPEVKKAAAIRAAAIRAAAIRAAAIRAAAIRAAAIRAAANKAAANKAAKLLRRCRSGGGGRRIRSTIDVELHTSVCCATLFVAVAFERSSGPNAFGLKTSLIDPSFNELPNHRFRTLLGEPQIGSISSLIIRVPLDSYMRELWVRLKERRHSIEDVLRARSANTCAGIRKYDLLEQNDAVSIATNERITIRASVVIANPVERLGFRGAAILRVGQPVSIGVFFWAAIGIVHAVDCFSLVWAFVHVVIDAVTVEVCLGTAVLISKAICVLWLTRTLVVHIVDAIAVRVRIGTTIFVAVAVHVFWVVGAGVEAIADAITVVVCVGTAVFVLEAIGVLRFDGAWVIGIVDAVAVVVGFGASVAVFPTVAVLGLGRTCVVFIDDAIAVAVAAVGCVGEATNGAEARDANTGNQSCAASESECEVTCAKTRCQAGFKCILIELGRETSGAVDFGKHHDEWCNFITNGGSVCELRPNLG
jgi:hypothetical protein